MKKMRLKVFASIFTLMCMATTNASAEMEKNRLSLTEKGHGGILFDGKAREQAGVPKDIADYILNMQDHLSDVRHNLHKIPEIGHKEVDTNAYLIKSLKDMGYTPKKIGTTTGIMVDLKGEDSSFTIGVRADIDGLPITEVDDGRAYRSTKEGFSHSCGHDNHTTIALGIAKAYAEGKVKPPCNIRFIFQPAEELGTGAKGLIDAGVLKGVDIIIGLHSDPTREWGTVGMSEKSFTAWLTGFTYEVTGKAAHGGAAIEKGKDALLTASYIVTQLQSIVSRNIASARTAVVTVGTFKAGDVGNQIADKAVLSGTTRAENEELHNLIKKRMVEIAKGTEIAMDMPVKHEVIVEAPGVNINKAMFDVVRKNSVKILGEKNVDVFNDPGMGGEDFAFYTQEIPGFIYWLGTANNEKGINAGLHTPEFDIDERALVVGVALQLSNIKALYEYQKSGGKF